MILGLSHPAEGFGHDAAVALVDENGRILAAQSEERFSRIKMDGSFPWRALHGLLRTTGVTAADLTAVAVPFLSARDKAVEAGRLLAAALGDPRVLVRQVANRLWGDQFQRGMAALGAYAYHADYRAALARVHAADGRPPLGDGQAFLRAAGLGTVPVVRVDHHLAHAAGAYFTSGWDEALVVTADGVGALKSGLVAVGRGGRLRVVARTFYPHSAGGFWEAVTVVCGFHHMKHGGKVTGLAAFGDPHAPCYALMRRCLWVDGLRVKSLVDPVALARALDGVSREDIAATAQRRLEEVFATLVRRAVARTGLRRVALAGGVFANVRLNQRLAQLDEVEEVYVLPPMGDEGLAVGAALWAAAKRRPLCPQALVHLYLGPDVDERAAARALASAGLAGTRLPDEELARRAAAALAAGKTVAVCRGRMEFGPRALGHRSIFADPRDRSINDWLNRRLRRSEFMPFAPVTLGRFADRCYVGLERGRHAARFMTVTFDCTPWMKACSPAVVHVDGSARPQIVAPEDDPFTSALLEAYFAQTGVPSLVNTSFNLHEEPIVCWAEDAVRAFREGQLDVLVLGPFLAEAAPAADGGARLGRLAVETTRGSGGR